MKLIGPFLVILLGVAAVVLGMRGLGKDGLPATSTKRIRGPWALGLGLACIALGVTWIVVGIWLGAGAPTE